MALALGNEQIIAGVQAALPIATTGRILKTQHRLTRQQQHSFVPVLLVPKPRWTDLPVRNDTLDAATGAAQQIVKAFAVQRLG